jgi:glutathione S-transferase
MSAATDFVPKLYYFGIPGKGEAIRLACTYGKMAFEDVRINGEQFAALKESGKLKYGQVPAFEAAEGQVITQSASIMRYVGKKTGLYPTDDIAAALVDSIIDQEADLFAGLGVTIYKERFGFDFLNQQPALVMQAREFLNNTTLPRHLQALNRLMEASTTGWIANTPEPSIADFVLVPRLQWLVGAGHEGISPTLLTEHCPKVAEMIERFMALPEIAAYYKK